MGVKKVTDGVTRILLNFVLYSTPRKVATCVGGLRIPFPSYYATAGILTHASIVIFCSTDWATTQPSLFKVQSIQKQQKSNPTHHFVSRVNDCILRVNNIDCRDVERATVLETLRNANSSVSLLIKRRKWGRRDSFFHNKLLFLVCLKYSQKSRKGVSEPWLWDFKA